MNYNTGIKFQEGKKPMWDAEHPTTKISEASYTLDKTNLIPNVVIPKGTPLELDHATLTAYVTETTETAAALYVTAPGTHTRADGLCEYAVENIGDPSANAVLAAIGVYEVNLPYPLSAANKTELATNKYFYFV